MKSNVSLVNAYMAFFIIHTSQIGMGILGVPKIVFLESNKDAWISVLLSGIFISLLIWMMMSILNKFGNCNLYEIHERVFGRTFGKILNTLLVTYFIAAHYSIIIGYLELALSWGYEGVYEWVGTLTLLLVTIYAVSSGFRVIAGVCFLSFIMTFWLLFVLYQPLDSLQVTRILPILSSPPSDLMEGVFRSSYTMLGFESLFFIYPFIKEKNKLHFFSQLAVWFTTFLVLIATIVSILFFSAEELKNLIWPIVQMISAVRFPFVERFEILGVSFWLLVIFPNLCIFLFISSKGIKQVFRLKQTHGIWVVSLIIFILSFIITKRVENDLFFDYIGRIGFYLWFIYPIFLFIISKFTNKTELEI